ncbi:MAG: hypothetical protein IT303_17425 [Dehalococcoidia bacterium]|nr:hypothetical protein [Dehalococcoidia bacterium]
MVDERALAMLREFRASAVALFGDQFVELRARQLPADASAPGEPAGVDVTVILRSRGADDAGRLARRLSRAARRHHVYFDLNVRALSDWDPAGELALGTVPIAA